MTQHGSPPLPAGVALSHPATQQALARFRRRWTRTVSVSLPIAAVSAISLPVAFALLVVRGNNGTPREDPLQLVAAIACPVAGVALLVGAVLSVGGWYQLGQAGRMSRTLAHHPWVTRAWGDLHGGSMYVPTQLLIRAEPTSPEVRCRIYGGFGRAWIDRLRATSGQPILVAGDPHDWAVVTPWDMQDLYVIQPLRRRR